MSAADRRVDVERYLGESEVRPLHFKCCFYPGATWVRAERTRREPTHLIEAQRAFQFA